MKSATPLALQLTQDLRDAAESVLREGETLTRFVEESMRELIERRRVQQAFIARGLAARDEARASGDYLDKETVTASLQAILERKRNSR